MSFTIQVNVDTIDYSPIIDYYNSHKLNNEQPLQILNRYEGGFEIKLDENSMKEYNNHNLSDSNFRIRQLRWSSKCLVTYTLSYKFTDYQLNLLYDSIKNTIGEKNIRKIDFIQPSAFSYVSHMIKI